MKLVFISGPYRAKTEYETLTNIREAEVVALEWWRKGHAVICPHKNTAFLGGACSDKVWLDGCLEMVRRSDIIVALPRWRQSVGARKEIALAKELGKEVVYVDDC